MTAVTVGFVIGQATSARQSPIYKAILDFDTGVQSKVVYIFIMLCQSQQQLVRASDILRKKKAKFHGIFRGKFAEKSAHFAGKKSKFAEQSADFRQFSREKSQNSQKNRPISWDFSRKKSIFEGFSGANS